MGWKQSSFGCSFTDNYVSLDNNEPGRDEKLLLIMAKVNENESWHL